MLAIIFVISSPRLDIATWLSGKTDTSLKSDISLDNMQTLARNYRSGIDIHAIRVRGKDTSPLFYFQHKLSAKTRVNESKSARSIMIRECSPVESSRTDVAILRKVRFFDSSRGLGSSDGCTAGWVLEGRLAGREAGVHANAVWCGAAERTRTVVNVAPPARWSLRSRARRWRRRSCTKHTHVHIHPSTRTHTCIARAMAGGGWSFARTAAFAS